MKVTDYLPLKDAAEILGVAPCRLRQLCGQGRVPGAVKTAGAWFLPKPIRILEGGRPGEIPSKIKMTAAS